MFRKHRSILSGTRLTRQLQHKVLLLLSLLNMLNLIYQYNQTSLLLSLTNNDITPKQQFTPNSNSNQYDNINTTDPSTFSLTKTYTKATTNPLTTSLYSLQRFIRGALSPVHSLLSYLLLTLVTNIQRLLQSVYLLITPYFTPP